MAWKSRPCSFVGCPEVLNAEQRTCPEHGRLVDRARGSRQQRGYDREYDKARATALADATHCASCSKPFTVDNPATGGHRTAVRHGGTVGDGIEAQCRKCNFGWRTSGN